MPDLFSDSNSAGRASDSTGASAMPARPSASEGHSVGDSRSGVKNDGKRHRSSSGDSPRSRKRGSGAQPYVTESPSGNKSDRPPGLARRASDPALTEKARIQGMCSHKLLRYRFRSGGPASACVVPNDEFEEAAPVQGSPRENLEWMSAMDSDRKEFENMVSIMCRKMAHIIVESRLGKKIHTPCKVHADVPDWFNLSLADMPEVVKEVKRLLLASGGLWDPAAPLTSFCVEISLKTADGVPLVLEQWALTLDTSTPSGAKPSATVVNQLGVLLKSLLVTTRLTIGYKLSRQQSQESHIIFYKIYIGEPDLQGLGEASEKMTIGEVGTPICTLNLSLHYRTKLAISTYSADPIVMKSDHFKPEQSPRIRRVTGFTERRPSDSVEMIGASSSSSSNMDTKTTGGSSTDSDQRRRVAAFADEPSDRAAPATDVPFLRLVGEPPPTTTTATDVSMTDGSATQPPPQEPGVQERRLGGSSQPRPVTAAASTTGAGAGAGGAPPSPAAGDDFVMRTPFSETSSDSELGAFFRQWQAAPTLPSLSGQQGPPAAAAASPPPTPDHQVVSLTEQLARFELKAQEFDDMIAQLDSQEASKQ